MPPELWKVFWDSTDHLENENWKKIKKNNVFMHIDSNIDWAFFTSQINLTL